MTKSEFAEIAIDKISNAPNARIANSWAERLQEGFDAPVYVQRYMGQWAVMAGDRELAHGDFPQVRARMARILDEA